MAAEDQLCAVEGSARIGEPVAILEVGRGFPAGVDAVASRGAGDSVAATGRKAEMGASVFVFPSQGTHWMGMAAELLKSASEFSHEMRRCDAAFAEFADWSLLDAVRSG